MAGRADRRGPTPLTEWAILAAVALLVAAYIAWPRPGDAVAPEEPEVDELLGERDDLLQELRELDDDAAAGRITAEDRAAARRAIGPHLRQVTEALRDMGEKRVVDKAPRP